MHTKVYQKTANNIESDRRPWKIVLVLFQNIYTPKVKFLLFKMQIPGVKKSVFYISASKMSWRWEIDNPRCENGDEGARAIGVMWAKSKKYPSYDLPATKKRINTLLIIDRKQGLYTQNDINKTFWPHWRHQSEIGGKIKARMRS